MNQPSASHAHPKGGGEMLIPIVVMGVLAVGLLVLGHLRGKGEHIEGLKGTKKMLIQVLPLLVFALIVANMVQVLVPKDTVSRLVGKESGIRGIIIGSIAGGVMPGGPYVNLPVVAGLIRAGAGVGTGVAFLTGWSIWALGRFPMELSVLGPRFTFIRLLSTCFFPPLAGLIARALFQRG